MTPTPTAIRAARIKRELTQARAAELIYLGAPQRWAEYESGTRNMPLASWELFLSKTKEVS